MLVIQKNISKHLNISMKLKHVVMLLAALTLTSVSKAQSPADKKPYLDSVIQQLMKVFPKNRTINLVFHGHSVPTGYGANHEVHTLDAYPFQLLEKLKTVYPYAPINVITTSIGGENSAGGSNRFENDVLPYRPDVVFIDYSLNELYEDMATVKRSWEMMIRTAQAHHIKVILMTPSPDQRVDICAPGNILEKHAEQVRQLAKAYHTGLVDSYALFKEKACTDNDLKKYMAAVNHPNRAGHNLIASAILQWFLLPKDASLALTPPMGWNSWNTFECNINEKLVMETADKLVSSGMKAAGYEYLILDDCWLNHQRDKDSNLVADPVKFPHGMKALADYVHSKGLKFGLYNDAGTLTCAGYPGTKGHEYQDAAYYASVGIDYLKFDWCNSTGQYAELSYITMANALRSTGRPIVFSICEWGKSEPWKWAGPVGQLWRTTGDITHKFDGQQKGMMSSGNNMMYIVDREQGFRAAAGPGHWNDPDMLEVGNGMSVAEDRTHFSLWAILAAPLIAGNDVTKMNDLTRNMLTNKDVIAVDQDALGMQGFRAATRDSVETWYRPLSKGGWAICIINRGKASQTINMLWEQLSVTDQLSGRALDLKKDVYNYYDVWSKQKGNTRKPLNVQLAPHDVWMVTLSK